MGKFTAYKLHLKGLPIGNHHFEYAVDSVFFKDMESADIRSGNVEVDLDLKYDGNAYSLDFTFKGEIIIACDRCLDDMPLDIDTAYNVIVKYGDEYDEKDNVLIIPESDNYLNVAYMIYDTIALEIPLRHVHPAGQCNKEMAANAAIPLIWIKIFLFIALYSFEVYIVNLAKTFIGFKGVGYHIS